jgi:hypothetical protein
VMADEFAKNEYMATPINVIITTAAAIMKNTLRLLRFFILTAAMPFCFLN